MARCCPDLIEPDAVAWAQLDSLPRGAGGPGSPQHEALVPLLRAAGSREMGLRRRVLHCVFWSGPLDPETGLPRRLEADEAAHRLGLPTARAADVLARAMASVPLASDPDGPLEVLFEDEHFLAVNKPVGLHTAPIHRFTAGSVVNRVIAHLNRGRCGQEAAGQLTLLSAADAGSVPPGYLPPLLPLPDPFTLAGGAADDSHGNSASSSTSSASGSSAGAVRQLEPYVLHRLDMATSGLLLFAKRPEVVAGVHRQFRERTVSKLYLAAAVGCPAPGLFDVDVPIDRHPEHDVARRVADTGKEASTSFAVICSNPLARLGPEAGGAPGLLFHKRATGGGGASSPSMAPAAAAGALVPDSVPRGASLLVCAPHSGRTHQIRVHLQHMGHPIVGDDIYGLTGPWISRQALHAASLAFTHPLTGRRVALAAPLHDDMAACLRSLGLAVPDVAGLADEWGEQLAAGRGPAAGAGRQGPTRESARRRQ
ncbi:hypothetical protein GPECTOR_17g944 [Gonium pectorale]|uniref:Pseudouridine synthase RsuA/RluA-like domain-containing protein n=1 Tax=Gonium pectorale TaxID=33097 RepID=A0A150GKQ3_GONPE|nr:hypothetical protein GPECTOR_17g944 [Gonium pectorale]|eukprot:KXZ50305.1 hypothetical protein GPECTOR_17g944 [Gonium pectorale]